MGSRSIPQLDMVNVANSVQKQRKSILKFVPPVGLTCVNYRSVGDVDSFYLSCQSHRDYYRDPANKTHRPLLFCQYQGKCGVKPDRSIAPLLEPVRWVRERQPVVYSEVYGQRLNLDAGIRINAHFAANSSTVFKR